MNAAQEDRTRLAPHAELVTARQETVEPVQHGRSRVRFGCLPYGMSRALVEGNLGGSQKLLKRVPGRGGHGGVSASRGSVVRTIVARSHVNGDRALRASSTFGRQRLSIDARHFPGESTIREVCASGDFWREKVTETRAPKSATTLPNLLCGRLLSPKRPLAP